MQASARLDWRRLGANRRGENSVNRPYIPLLRAGLPPIVIPVERRQRYLQLLADYELALGAIDQHTGVWPKPGLLADFAGFCADCYAATRRLVRAARGDG